LLFDHFSLDLADLSLKDLHLLCPRKTGSLGGGVIVDFSFFFRVFDILNFPVPYTILPIQNAA